MKFKKSEIKPINNKGLMKMKKYLLSLLVLSLPFHVQAEENDKQTSLENVPPIALMKQFKKENPILSGNYLVKKTGKYNRSIKGKFSFNQKGDFALIETVKNGQATFRDKKSKNVYVYDGVTQELINQRTPTVRDEDNPFVVFNQNQYKYINSGQKSLSAVPLDKNNKTYPYAMITFDVFQCNMNKYELDRQAINNQNTPKNQDCIELKKIQFQDEHKNQIEYQFSNMKKREIKKWYNKKFYVKKHKIKKQFIFE